MVQPPALGSGRDLDGTLSPAVSRYGDGEGGLSPSVWEERQRCLARGTTKHKTS